MNVNSIITKRNNMPKLTYIKGKSTKFSIDNKLSLKEQEMSE